MPVRRRIRLALGGAILGTCLVGFIGGYSGDAWQLWVGAGGGFVATYWWLGAMLEKKAD